MARPRGKVWRPKPPGLQPEAEGKLVAYVRVSTLEQANGHSLAAQEAELRRVAEAKGYEIVRLVQDVACGAADRDGLREAQGHVNGGRAEGLIFYRIDRVGRSMFQLVGLKKWAEDGGFTLLSANEGMLMDRGKTVNELFPLQIALAEMELVRIRERTRLGLAAAKARGVRLGRVRRTEPTDPAAVRAKELRRQGLSIQQVANTLNAEGFKTVEGNQWWPGNTHTLLRRIAPELLPGGKSPEEEDSLDGTS